VGSQVEDNGLPDETNHMNWFEEALKLTMTECYGEAIPAYLKAVENGDNVSESLALLSQALFLVGRADDALAASDEGKGLPMSRRAYFTFVSTRASILSHVGRHDDAVATIEDSLPIVDDNRWKASLLVQLASLRSDRGEIDAAMLLIRQAHDLDPGNQTASAVIDRLGDGQDDGHS
jgi:tetratricopeptide (TPR) repeat protein